jgi:hypothetical protein
MTEADPPRRSDRWRHLLLAAAAVVATLAVIVASGLVPAVLLRAVGAPLPAAAPQPTGGFFSFMAASQVVMIAGALLAAVAIARRDSPPLGFAAPAGGLRTYAAAIGLTLAVPGAINLVRYFVLGDDLLADLRVFAPLFRNPLWPLAFLIITIGAPVAEELLFRGFLQSRLMRLGFAVAAIVPTLIWSAMHSYSIGGMVLVVTLGVLFAQMRRQTGSLRVPIVAHAVNNGLVALFLQFGPRLT